MKSRSTPGPDAKSPGSAENRACACSGAFWNPAAPLSAVWVPVAYYLVFSYMDGTEYGHLWSPPGFSASGDPKSPAATPRARRTDPASARARRAAW